VFNSARRFWKYSRCFGVLSLVILTSLKVWFDFKWRDEPRILKTSEAVLSVAFGGRVFQFDFPSLWTVTGFMSRLRFWRIIFIVNVSELLVLSGISGTLNKIMFFERAWRSIKSEKMSSLRIERFISRISTRFVRVFKLFRSRLFSSLIEISCKDNSDNFFSKESSFPFCLFWVCRSKGWRDWLKGSLYRALRFSYRAFTRLDFFTVF